MVFYEWLKSKKVYKNGSINLRFKFGTLKSLKL